MSVKVPEHAKTKKTEISDAKGVADGDALFVCFYDEVLVSSYSVFVFQNHVKIMLCCLFVLGQRVAW